jgi:hypothetical protein
MTENATREGNRSQSVREASVLEIHVSRRAVGQYSAELRYSRAGDAADMWFPGSKLIGFAALAGSDAEIDPVATGAQLRDDLCSDPEIMSGLRSILAIAGNSNEPLHVRLFIDPGAAELQRLPWETLRAPDDGQFLFANDRYSFSRFLGGSDFRRVELRSRGELKASVIIANPAGVEDVDVPAQLELARQALSGMDLKEFASGGSATVDRIVERVREGDDILFIVCHGMMKDDQPYLALEKPDGGLERVRGEDLVEQLQGLRERPRLIVLLSCNSAGDDFSFTTALGPRLAAIGVPAVLAMRGEVPIESARQFLARFFSELRQHGVLDQAAATARREVQDRGAAWMPVLFTRLRSGRLWYTPGFLSKGGQGGLSERWNTLVDRIARGNCTPILGPGVTEPLLGSSRDLALSWSREFGFPLAPEDREDLTRVAQYLASNQDQERVRELFEQHIVKTLRTKYGDRLGSDRGASLRRMIEAAWKAYSADREDDPLRVLAQLPFPLYLTTNTDLLLETALESANRRPKSELCPWNPRLDLDPSIFERQADYWPTAIEPLVYHLFGHMDVEGAGPLLTEDDYFDYLIGLTTNRDRIPKPVKRAMLDRVLLFVGFQIDDWNFRILFRSITNHQNRDNMRRYSHVAVQLDPEEGRILEPERARRYLENYFEHLGNISIFWGSAEEFTGELRKRWRDAESREAAE